MPTVSRARSSTLAIVAAALALAPATVRAAPPAKPCVRLVALNLQRLDRSAIIQLQQQVQAHQGTALMVDALGQRLALGAAWKAGNPHWEEAFALFRPDLFAVMRAGGEREMRRIEAKLPRLLDPATCRKAVALLDSPAGAAAVRIEDAADMGQFLASFEKQFGVPPSLKKEADAAHQEVAEAVALKDDPEVQRAGPKLAAARAEWRGYSKQYATALKRLGDADPAAEQKASQEAGARMMAKNQQAFADIVRRFRGK